MKCNILLLIFLFLLSFKCSYGQNLSKNECKYNCLESLLNNIDRAKNFEEIFGLSKSEYVKKTELCEITAISIEDFKSILYQFNEYASIYCFRNLLNSEILELKNFQEKDNYHLLIRDLKEKKRILDDYTNLMVENNYVQYASQQSSKTWLKSVHIFHDNDIFLFSKLNADRDYTGGFRFEFITDQFKMRLFKNFGNTEQFLSYQSIFIGGEGYTPYIRFTENELKNRNVLYEIDEDTRFFTPESFDAIENHMRSNQQLSDRPFASFQYFGRGKYRLHHTGIFRAESLFKIGKVGGKVGENIQAVIHQDLTTGSQRVLNWGDQIGEGGRLAVNMEHKIDISLFSTNSLSTYKSPIKNNFLNEVADYVNIYLPFEVALGTVQTYLGTGIGISNKAFREISGINDVRLVKPGNVGLFRKAWARSYISMEYNYRRVIHNSMLEGVGLFRPFIDDPLDDEAITIYSLDEQDVERNLHKLQWHIGFRVNKITFYYKHVRFINKEFNVVDSNPNFKEFSTQKWYGYGRLGFNFLL